MFERYLSDLVTTHFGHVIANLDHEKQMRVSLQGAVVLEDVELRRDALDHYLSNAPFEIAYGRVGRLEVRIPWKLVRAQLFLSSPEQSTATSTTTTAGDPSQAMTVVLNDVNILITPRKRRAQSGSQEEEVGSEQRPQHEGEPAANGTNSSSSTNGHDDDNLTSREEEDWERQQAVQEAMDKELLRRVAQSSQPLRHPEDEAAAAVTHTWKWKLQERAKAVLSNLAVTVQNIHIRYEDPGTSLGFQWNVRTAGDCCYSVDGGRGGSPLLTPPREGTTTTTPRSNTNSPEPPPTIMRYRPPFAIGVTLEQFTVHTAEDPAQMKPSTAQNGTAETAAEVVPNNVQKKVAAASQLAAYWDSDVHIMSDHDDETATRYEGIFSFLKTGEASDSDHDFRAFQRRHSFILDPFSPSIQFGLAASGAKNGKSSCNTMDLALPPCRFTLSRSLLEDLAYIRQSLAVWMHAKKGLLLPEETLRMLTSLRPSESAVTDPRGWWLYAFAAVCALNESSNNDGAPPLNGRGIERSSSSMRFDSTVERLKIHRSKGWIGLAQALGRRRRYVELYEAFIKTRDGEDRLLLHETLLVYERDLLIREIVAFRIAAYNEIRKAETSWDWITTQIPPIEDGSAALSSVEGNSPTQVLSVEHRAQLFLEMAVALNREQRNIDLQQHIFGNESLLLSPENVNEVPVAEEGTFGDIAWKTSLKCSELSFQVNDSRRLSDHRGSTSAAVVRLCCAFAQEQELYRDGSWVMTNRIGSFVVKDCTGSSSTLSKSAASPYSFEQVFPNLIGPKSGEASIESDNDTFSIDGTAHRQTIWININRTKTWSSSGQIGSTTTTRVRVLPLEIVYATAPVESLNHVMNTTELGLGDDYNRIASRMSAWRERQQNRLLQALAHKQKKINVDVVVGAPVLLLPESRHPSSPLLIMDLGRLRFFNDTGSTETRNSEFDDKWKLDLTDIQIQSSSTSKYRGFTLDAAVSETRSTASQQLIEPFSLQFSISTKIHVEGVSEGQTSICVHATLPRLAVNLTSSAVRLLRRLNDQWKRRKKARRPSVIFSSTSLVPNGGVSSQKARQVSGDDRRLEFEFVAPLFSVKFENDEDGRERGSDHLLDSSSAPLFDLALRGLEGSFLRESVINGISTSFSAKVRTLGVVDLCQDAGDEFSLLLSSLSPDFIGTESQSFERYLSGTDLVSFEYKSLDRSGDSLHDEDPKDADEVDLLSVEFNELFVEWNPETLAAISAALSMPIDAKENLHGDPDHGFEDHARLDLSIRTADEFFDAHEDVFFDAESASPDEFDDSSRLLSEISESGESSCNDLGAQTKSDTSALWMGLRSPLSRVALTSAVYGSPWSKKTDDTPKVPPPVTARKKPFEIVFKLSKLRVNFNKESRHRRLMTAEMDGTSIRYRTMQVAGSRTLVTIGNLTFADCESQKNKTLYREILGLKTDARSGSSGVSSLLEMEMIMQPHNRQYISLEHKVDDPASEVGVPVSIDYGRGTVHGFDNFLRARFSPMRFVYLQQLWFEIVDYFFAGVIGNEVWGGITPTPGDMKMLEGASVLADRLSFTRFDVKLDAPVIMLPVSSCSTDFIRLEASSISFRNHHTYDQMRPPTMRFRADGGNRQWYNNCKIAINEVTLQSWSGNTLNQKNNRPTAHLNLCWPVGPSAPVNVPKWKAGCDFDALHLDLDRPDYALLQHVVQYNMGEESHHLDEWFALKALPSKTLQRYLESILVHFGYDKKDSTPSTFDVEIRVPLIAFSLKHDNREEIAVIRCSDVCWQYKKSTDRVSRQRVACDIDIVGSMGGKAILSSSQQQSPFVMSRNRVPALTYTTTTEPSGNNTKTLDIADAIFLVIYPAWKDLSAFFQSLPEPSYLSPDEAIQVGDRWYRISEQSPSKPPNESKRKFRWIDGYEPPEASQTAEGTIHIDAPAYEFRCSFLHPCIRLGSGDQSLELSIENIDLLHNGKNNLIQRTIRFLGIEVQTRGVNQEKRPSDFSLIRPWSVAASMEGCNGRHQCCCKSHQFRITADILYARAAFSDLTVALDAGMHFIRDMRETKQKTRSTLPPASPSPSLDDKESFDATKDVNEPKHRSFRFEWTGLRLVVADDSGRHFVGDQDLIVFLVQDINLVREETKVSEPFSSRAPFEYTMLVSVKSLDLIDCLQSKISPFRDVLRIRSSPIGFSDTKKIPVSPSSEQPPLFCTYDESASSPASPPNVQTNSVDNGPAVELWSEANESKSYGVDLRSLEAQYNPSVVVALQRFLGRLVKEAKKKHADILAEPSANAPKESGDSGPTLKEAQFIVTRGKIDIRFMSWCLNKEHQRRRLLEAVISHSHMELEWNEAGSYICGHIRALEATDPAGKETGFVAEVIRSAPGFEKFIAFQYRTFAKRSVPDSPTDEIPAWILAHLDAARSIDDFLDISVSSVEAVFVRDRTEELLDYLSNGMPGKGMGATSRAAKGFVNDRIQRQSFFNVHIGEPKFIIPEDRTCQSLISICFASCKLNSWIATSDVRAESRRMLSVHLQGLSGDVHRKGQTSGRAENEVISKIDFSVDIAMAASASTMSCRLSDVVTRLSYMDYVTLRRILRDNIGRKIDKSKWDNLEVAWEKETGRSRHEIEEQQAFSNEVTYSTSARLVRYGQGEKKSSKKTPTTLDLYFESLSVLLQRDDELSTDPYDMVLARIQGFELGVGRKEDGDQWMNASLKQIFVFDLGRAGRQKLRSHVKTADGFRTDDCVTVLLQGYTPPKNQELSGNFDSQIVLKVDKDAPPSNRTKVICVVSFLSIAPMTEPLRDVVDFVSCDWGDSAFLDTNSQNTESSIRESEVTEPSQTLKPCAQRIFQVQFVSHYPRLVFAADENDLQSKALILRGLWIANVNFKHYGSSGHATEPGDKISELTVTADFQDVSSYMTPEISGIIAIEEPHTIMIESVRSDAGHSPLQDFRRGYSLDDIGVRILLPLTVSVEFEEKRASQSPKERSIAVNIEPLSVLLSHEDFQLVRSVAKSWTSTRKASKRRRRRYYYEATFESKRLGLGLRKQNGRIVVDNIGNSLNSEKISTGDALFAINGQNIFDSEDLTLSEMVQRLASEPRPLRVTFLRLVDDNRDSKQPEANNLSQENMSCTVDNIDISLAKAVLTMMENEVPLFKGSVSTTKIACQLTRSEEKNIKFDLSSSIGIDYYNLRIWGWEPFVEPGIIFVSSTFQEQSCGPSELALEIGDRDSGLFVNITDSLGETISKMLEWRKEIDDDIDIDEFILNDSTDLDQSFSRANDTVSRKAANVALRFASRQKNDSAKPFIFRNKTGLSVAFAQQNRRAALISKRSKSKRNLFEAVGDYKGLASFDPSEIMVVANDEELKFRVDVVSGGMEGGIQVDSAERLSKYPTLTMSLQETDGITADPFERLPINRPGISILPLSYSSRHGNASRVVCHGREWVTWLVEHANEKTVLTLGSSVRVASLLTVSVVLGIEVDASGSDTFDPKKVMPIGSVRFGAPFCLPLWIAMQRSPCRCSVKLHGSYQFAPLFYISSEGSIKLARTISNCIECKSTQDDNRSAWLAVSKVDDRGIETINIDCSISMRNLLPAAIDWEIGDDSQIHTRIIDGTTLRKVQPLKSGKQAEVLSKGWHSLKIRLRPSFENSWSGWTPLLLPVRRSAPKKRDEDENVDAEDESVSTHLCPVNVNDGMNIPLSMGLRVAPKINGLDVTIYTELWCTNCTPFNIVFGTPKKHIMETNDCNRTGSTEFSAAEATLNEISALFESGDAGAGLTQSDNRTREIAIDVVRLPGQIAPHIVEECFEYLEVEGLNVRRRWWAGEDALSPRANINSNNRAEEDFDWIDKSWKIDDSGKSSDGWESAPNLSLFSPRREFYPSHKYRRRRWTRTRLGLPKGTLVNGVDAYFQPVALSKEGLTRREKNRKQIGVQVAVQVDGGKWSTTAVLPSQGTVYGVLRALKARWPEAPIRPTEMGNPALHQRCELCYSISPLEGDWGLLTRSMLVTSRFLLRNDSLTTSFEVKQTGADDMTSVTIPPGQTTPFHWGDFRLPELVSVRPVLKTQGRCVYKWSGGFDPLTIGSLPLRTRLTGDQVTKMNAADQPSIISAIKIDVEIRPKSGGTGINLSFKEENSTGEGALYRIENFSPFPVWVCQDDVLANPSSMEEDEDQGDYLSPFESVAFALDVPFKQGKYSHRKAASMDILLRARLALSPLSSRAGIETTKVVSLTTPGSIVRLNPSKLMLLDATLRATLQHVRVVCVLHNDGPTRVLSLRLMEKDFSEREQGNIYSSSSPTGGLGRLRSSFYKAILDGATNAAERQKKKELKAEEEVVRAIFAKEDLHEQIHPSVSTEQSLKKSKDLVISFRAAFSGLVISLIDSAPSEIAVATFKNVNAIATWDMLRNTDSTIYVTVTGFQVDNMVPNAPFPVAVCPFELQRGSSSNEGAGTTAGGRAVPPLLVIGLSFAPRHKSGIVCLKSATIAPRNLAIKVDLAFIVRMQKFALDMQEHFMDDRGFEAEMTVPDIKSHIAVLDAAAASGVGRQKIYFRGLTILPCSIKLSVAPARALTPAQAIVEGEETAAIHQAVRKGDVLLGRKNAGILGVKVGSRNKTPLAVVRGMFKSFVVDGLLRLDGASLNFAGVSLTNYTSTGPQLTTALGAHYLASLRQNLPAVLGSMAAIGNPLGLVRGLGEGVGDFVLEPVRGFQRSVQEMDASYLVDGVARGTLSLARHTVGGFADSAAMLAETFSKNMTVLTLDRRYAQQRDRGDMLREHDDINVASGLGSGVQKLVLGFLDGVTGVVKAPIRGAEKRGLEGFAKGIGKGLLGLLVKPIIGISDGFTDVMIGVKGTVDGAGGQERQLTQVRPRRALYGREKAIRSYHFADAAASALMLRTRLAGEPYLNHVDMGDRVALLSVKRLLILGRRGEELLLLKLKHIDSVEVRNVSLDDNSPGWGIIVLLNTPRSNGSEVEVITCKEKSQADELCAQIQQGKRLAMADAV